MKVNNAVITHTKDPWVGSKGHIFFSFHVAYQIKLEEVYTYMQGNTLNLHTPLTSGVGLKGQLL